MHKVESYFGIQIEELDYERPDLAIEVLFAIISDELSSMKNDTIELEDLKTILESRVTCYDRKKNVASNLISFLASVQRDTKYELLQKENERLCNFVDFRIDELEKKYGKDLIESEARAKRLEEENKELRKKLEGWQSCMESFSLHAHDPDSLSCYVKSLECDAKKTEPTRLFSMKKKSKEKEDRKFTQIATVLGSADMSVADVTDCIHKKTGEIIALKSDLFEAERQISLYRTAILNTGLLFGKDVKEISDFTALMQALKDRQNIVIRIGEVIGFKDTDLSNEEIESHFMKYFNFLVRTSSK